jgi:hypothetical protein
MTSTHSLLTARCGAIKTGGVSGSLTVPDRTVMMSLYISVRLVAHALQIRLILQRTNEYRIVIGHDAENGLSTASADVDVSS